MSNFKFHIDKPLPDPRRIAGHRDFDSLYDRYQVTTRFAFWRRLYRNPRFFATLVAVAAVVYLVFEADETPPADTRLATPVPAHPLPWQPLTATSDGWISADSGLHIEAPVSAFTDAAGDPVSGSVELRCRYLRDAADLFVSGLPLHDDSAGVHRLFEMAEVLELAAWQDGRPLRLRPGARLRATRYRPDADSDWAAYRFDADSARWLRTGPDSVAQQDLAPWLALLPPRPVLDAPSAAAAEAPTRPFGVRIENAREYAELPSDAVSYWSSLPGAIDPWAAGLVGPRSAWDEVRVKRLAEDRYELIFGRNTPQGYLFRRVLARPLAGVRSDAEARQWYQQQQQAYAAAQAAAARHAAQRAALQRWKAARDSLLARVPLRVAHRFEVVAMGYSGLLRPVHSLPARQGVRLVAAEDGGTIDSAQVWAVVWGLRSLVPIGVAPSGAYALPVGYAGPTTVWVLAPGSTRLAAGQIGQPEASADEVLLLTVQRLGADTLDAATLRQKLGGSWQTGAMQP
ncbi:MAG: hypothetical protein OHK0039_17130 [Bacteroidia bacterium]